VSDWIWPLPTRVARSNARVRWPLRVIDDGVETTLVAVKTEFSTALQGSVITTEDGRRWVHRARGDLIHLPAEPDA